MITVRSFLLSISTYRGLILWARWLRSWENFCCFYLCTFQKSRLKVGLNRKFVSVIIRNMCLLAGFDHRTEWKKLLTIRKQQTETRIVLFSIMSMCYLSILRTESELNVQASKWLLEFFVTWYCQFVHFQSSCRRKLQCLSILFKREKGIEEQKSSRILIWNSSQNTCKRLSV